MSFDWRPLMVGVLIGVSIMLAVFIVPAAVAFERLPFCDRNETGLTCARNWANAIAIFTAVGTIFLLLQQVAEQSKQTAFLIGDAKPTFDVFCDKVPVVYFRIVNWNRRTFVIERIVSKDLLAISIIDARLEHKDEKIELKGDSADFDRPIRVAAYDNRSVAPAILRLTGIAFGGGPKSKTVTFQLHGRLLGDRHQNVVLIASGVVVQLQ